MAYEVEAIDVTGGKLKKEKVVDPRSKKGTQTAAKYKWWAAQNDADLCAQLLSTAEYLKRQNQMRIRQASIFTRLYSGKPLYNFLASTATLDNSNQLPIGRPTANITYSCTDTLVSRISQDKPDVTFLTRAGHYRQQKMAKEAHAFTLGEFDRLGIYKKAPLMLRDSCILGNGLFKVFAQDAKVTLQRTLDVELLTDYNDAYYGEPREIIQLKLVDRDMFSELFPDKADLIAGATHGNVDNTPRSTETVSDQFIIAEGWHLPSSKDADDGRHSLVCSNGIIHDKVYKKDKFPFIKMGYNPNIIGWHAQGLAEILMPTQMELYRTLIIASQNLEIMGVPRVLVEEMSKILETSFNNRIGSIIKYRNTKPEFVNAQANNPETYQYIQWLIQNGQNMAGLNQMATSGQKPAGLNSGESIREWDGVQDDRFAALQKRYQDIFPDAASLIIDCAADIVKETGKPYLTTYADKSGTREIDFKAVASLKDTYVIRSFIESSLPQDPAGRQARLSEMLAAGEITIQEFRRLSSFPDLEQSDQLANALEERILENLDAIIEDGEKGYQAPDNFMLDPSDLGTTLTVNYINKYAVTDIEPEKMDLLRHYFAAFQTLKQQATPPPPQIPPGGGLQGQLPPVQPPNAPIGPSSGAQV